MEKELERIMAALEKIFPGKNPMIEIFGDGSWMVEIDGTYSGGSCRLGGSPSGNSIAELETFIAKNLKS